MIHSTSGRVRKHLQEKKIKKKKNEEKHERKKKNYQIDISSSISIAFKTFLMD